MLTGLGLAPGRFKEESWAVVWKEAETSQFRDFLLSFGLSGSAAEAMDKVQRKLAGDVEFRRAHAGGTFYPVPAHMGVLNAKRPGEGP